MNLGPVIGDLAAAFGGPLGLLVKVATMVPSIMKYAGADDTATKVATEVVSIAQDITGIADPKSAVENALNNKEFQLRVMAQQALWDQMYLADVQSARNKAVEEVKAGSKRYTATSMYVLAVLVIAALTYAVLADDNLNEYAKGIITLVLGRFLGYLDGIYNFEFGTTRTSAAQQATISKLSGGS